MHISTHVLDTGLGLPAKGIKVELFGFLLGRFELLDCKVTDLDGRVEKFDFSSQTKIFKLRFAVSDYFLSLAKDSFFENVQIEFKVEENREKLHVPLLLSAYSYCTYRGS